MPDEYMPQVYWCQWCEMYHNVNTSCSEYKDKLQEDTAVAKAIERIGLWAVCVECWEAVKLSNPTRCPKCLVRGMLIYLDFNTALCAIRVGIPGSLEAAEALHERQKRDQSQV